jgi:hypothetical protein
MLWLPVAMGLGIAVYFELPSEPALSVELVSATTLRTTNEQAAGYGFDNPRNPGKASRIV